MTKALRLEPKARTRQLTEAALALAEAHGYRQVTRDQIAARAGVSPALVSLHLGTMESVRRAIIRAAIHAGNARVVAQGLAANDPHAREAPDELKQAAAVILIKQAAAAILIAG